MLAKAYDTANENVDAMAATLDAYHFLESVESALGNCYVHSPDSAESFDVWAELLLERRVRCHSSDSLAEIVADVALEVHNDVVAVAAGAVVVEQPEILAVELFEYDKRSI